MSLEEVQITPWELDNNFGITKSSVDKQDEYTLEDLTDNYKSAIGNFNGKTLLNTGLQFLSQTYVGQAANYVKGQLGKAGVAVNDSTRPVNTVSQTEDTLGADFKTLKNNKYKNIKLTSKLGQYNSMTNLLGNASGVLVGTLGKSAVTNVADSMLGGFLNSLPFGSLASKAISTTTKIVQSVKETKEKDSTVISTLTPTGKDLIALTAANYYSILTNKPGLTIRSHGNRLEHITGNKNEAPLETDREKEVREKNTKKDSTTAKSIRNNLISKKRNSDYETLIDDAAVIDTEIKRPSNLKEYVTGLFSSKDPLEENKIEKTSEAVGTPNKTDLEEEVKLINNKKFRPVEYVTNTNVVSSSSDGTIGLISTEELDKFIQNYKFFNKTSGKDGIYNTNSELNGITLSTKNTSIKKSTVINSILRKEVNIGPNSQLNSIEEVANYKGNDELIGTDNNYGRIGVANIYNRVNDTYRRIGGLYVEPFYNGVLNCFEIPFEFNPKISENNNQADYNTSEIMGRIIKVNNYKSSTPASITIEAEYYATSDDGDNNSSNGWLNGWMKDWTPEKLAKVERQYRALTLPYIKDGNFVKPPLVRIKMRSISSKILGTLKNDKDALRNTDKSAENKESLTVGDLFRYPSVDGRMQITEHFDGSTRDKRYIVKSVQINKLDDSFSNNYGYFDIGVDNYRSVKRRGFKVSIVLEETTKNFLDLIPNYYEYTKGITDDPIEIGEYNEDFKFVPAELSDIWSCLDQKIAFKVNNKVLIKTQTKSSDGTKDNANKPFTVYTTSDKWYYILQTDGDNATSTYAAHYPENPPKEGELSTMISGAFNSDEKVYSSFAYKTEDIIEENSETNDLLVPEADKNKKKTAEEYTKSLKDEEGLSIKEIINLLKNTSWENNEGYKKWLWEGGNKFTGNWVEYYKILKTAGYEDSEIIKNTFNEYWKNKKEYKEWLILSTKYINNCYDVDIKFGELIKIAKEVNEGMATIISSFKGSKYDTDGSDYNRWLGYTTWYDGDYFDNFNILYNCMERAGYSKDEMDCLLQKGWGNYDYLKLKVDKGYWEVFKDEAEILLRRMSIEEYVSLYKERESNFSWKNLIEALSKTNKSTSKDYIKDYRTFVLDKMYEEKLDFYSPLSKDKDKIVYYILSNYYSDGQIKYLCENTEFANYSIEYKAWLILTKAQREEIEYEDNFEGYNFYNDEEAKDVDKAETTNAVKEDNTDLNFEEVDYWKNEDVDAIQMFVHFFRHSDDDNNYLAPTDTDLVNVKEDSIKSLMEFPKDTSKAYKYNVDNKKVEETDVIK